MDSLTSEQIEVLRLFCLKLIPDFKGEFYNMPYLNFVFNDADINSIKNYLESMEIKDDQVYLNIHVGMHDRKVDASVINEVIDILVNTKKEYEETEYEETEYEETQDKNAIYISVSNAKDFFTLLGEITQKFEDNYNHNSMTTTSLLRTLWLRMGASDTNNIYAFLYRQKEFIKNDYLFNMDETKFHKLGDLDISYVNRGNEAWFETNRHIHFYIKKKKDKKENELNEFENDYLYYSLPVIHYGLIKEDNILVV